MSAKATAKVWEHSKAKGSEKLLLLCYADYADDNGLGACPSMPTLCQKTGLTRQGLTDVRRRLVEAGEIYIRDELSDYGTPTVDIAYGDGSNQAYIEVIHETGKTFTDDENFYPDGQSFDADAEDLPSEQKFCVNDSVVDVNTTLEGRDISVNRTLGQKIYPNGKSFAQTAKVLPPKRSMSELDFNRTLFQTAGIQEPALTRLAEKATAEQLPATVARAWVNSIRQLRDSNSKINDPIAFAISQVDKQGFKPLVPPKTKTAIDPFEDAKRRYGGYMQNTGTGD